MHREVLWDWRHLSYQRATISVANAKEPKQQMCASRTMSKPMNCEMAIDGNVRTEQKKQITSPSGASCKQMHADKSRDIEATPIMLNPLDMSIQHPTQCRATYQWQPKDRKWQIFSLPSDASQVCIGEETQWIVGVKAQLWRTDTPDPNQELRTNVEGKVFVCQPNLTIHLSVKWNTVHLQILEWEYVPTAGNRPKPFETRSDHRTHEP